MTSKVAATSCICLSRSQVPRLFSCPSGWPSSWPLPEHAPGLSNQGMPSQVRGTAITNSGEAWGMQERWVEVYACVCGRNLIQHACTDAHLVTHPSALPTRWSSSSRTEARRICWNAPRHTASPTGRWANLGTRGMRQHRKIQNSLG